MYYRIEETTSEERRAINFALDTVIEDLERAYRLMVSLYEDYAYEMPNCSQWEDVRDRSNVIIDIVHNAIFSYKLTVGDASAVRDYVEAAERVRLAANVEKAMAALLNGVPDGERDKMIEDRDKIGMMKDAEALPALEALRKGEWKA